MVRNEDKCIDCGLCSKNALYMTIKEVAEQAKMEVKEVKNIAPEYDFQKLKESK